MDGTNSTGFTEMPHTADWALRVWAVDFPGLLRSAAQGMYTLMGVHYTSVEVASLEIIVKGDDREAILVAFLSELLYLIESEGLVFEPVSIRMINSQLVAQLSGRETSPLLKEIKAVTYHNLSIQDYEERVECEIVFDV